MNVTFKRNRRARVIDIIITAAVAIMVLLFMNRGNYETEGDNVYFYFPEEYDKSGWQEFRDIKSKDKSGVRICYDSPMLFGVSSNENTEIPEATAFSVSDAAKGLKGYYSEDGRLVSVAFTEERNFDFREKTGLGTTSYYLMMRTDSGVEEASQEEFKNHCAEVFAKNIAESVRYYFSEKKLSEIILECRYNSVNQHCIKAYIRDSGGNEESAPVESFSGIDEYSMLKAVFCSCDGECEELSEEIAAKAADIINNEYLDRINIDGKASVRIAEIEE